MILLLCRQDTEFRIFVLSTEPIRTLHFKNMIFNSNRKSQSPFAKLFPETTDSNRCFSSSEKHECLRVETHVRISVQRSAFFFSATDDITKVDNYFSYRGHYLYSIMIISCGRCCCRRRHCLWMVQCSHKTNILIHTNCSFDLHWKMIILFVKR